MNPDEIKTGQTVIIENSEQYFEAVYLGETSEGNARVRDVDSGDILIGSFEDISTRESALAG